MYRSKLKGRGAAMLAGAISSAAVNRLYRSYKAKPKPKPKGRMLVLKKAPYKSTGSSLKKRLSNLEKASKADTSKLIYKYDEKGTVRPTVASASYSENNAFSIATLELALANLRFFDPSTPGTLITASLASPTFQQRIMVSAVSAYVVKNNYQVPCVITYGCVKPREDTSQTPNVARTNGLTDTGNPDATSTLLSWKDSPQYNQLWSGKLITKTLKPGQQVVIKSYVKSFMYDPALFDTHNLTFQRKNKSSVFICRCQGVLGHDTAVSTEQGMLPAGVDCYITTVYTISYNSGGAAVRTIVLNELASQSFTNAGVISQTVQDNQSYSIS